MHSDVYAEFSLHSPTVRDFDSSVIATTLEIESGIAFRVGDAIPGSKKAKRRDAGWVMKSTLPRSEDLREHIADVLALVHPKREVIKELVGKLGLEAIVCGVVYSYDGDRPPLVLEADQVRQIAELGASFWIDLYVLRSDP